MVLKGELMKSERETTEILENAYTKGFEYLPRWRACAPTVFAAVMDSIGYDDDPVVREVWKATIGLTGGTGNMAVGTCGAMAGAAAAVSFSFGYSREDLQDIMKMLAVNNAVAEVGEKMSDRYGHITCQEVQFRHWGKSFRLSNPEALMEFAALTSGDDAKTECREVAGDLTRWAVEAIMKHNPGFIR